MSSMMRLGIQQCTPSWQRHEWEIEARSLSKIYKVPTAIRCVHCGQRVQGSARCDYAITRDGLYQPESDVTE